MTMTTMPFPGDGVTPTPTGGGINLDAGEPAGTPAPVSTPDPGVTPTQASAKGQLDAFLATYGLQSLGDQAWSWYLSGQSTDQIMLNLRGTAEYKARFPAMEQLAQRGQALTESQYINYEQSIAQQNQAVGLPQGMYDTPDDIKNLLLANVSPSEYQSRLQAYQTAAYQSDPATYQHLVDYYGMSPGQATAFFIDPGRALPLIQRDLTAAQIGGAATTTGYGEIGVTQAEQLGQIGVTQAQAQQGFGHLATQSQLFTPLNAGENQIGQQAQIGAEFGNDAAAQQAIKDRQARRLADFNQGGGFTSSQQGFSGAK